MLGGSSQQLDMSTFASEGRLRNNSLGRRVQATANSSTRLLCSLSTAKKEAAAAVGTCRIPLNRLARIVGRMD